jgi:hypothetical protein
MRDAVCLHLETNASCLYMPAFLRFELAIVNGLHLQNTPLFALFHRWIISSRRWSARQGAAFNAARRMNAAAVRKE